MDTLVKFLDAEIWCLLGALVLIVGYQILTGKINTKNMLSEKDGTGGFSVGRVQLLVVTLTGALYFFVELGNNPGVFPQLPPELLAVLTGSHLFYLGNKALSLLTRLSPRP